MGVAFGSSGIDGKGASGACKQKPVWGGKEMGNDCRYAGIHISGFWGGWKWCGESVHLARAAAGIVC